MINYLYCSFCHLSSDIQVLEADMLDLPFANGSFDVVIEKGTMVSLKFAKVLIFKHSGRFSFLCGL